MQTFEWRLAGCRARADGKDEAGAAPSLALDANCAPHQLHQTAANRQPEASAAILAGGRSINLCKSREQAIDLVRRDADASVVNRKFEHQFLRRPALRRLVAFELLQIIGERRGAKHAALDAHFAFVGELDRITGQVDQHLAQARDVARNERRHGWIHFVEEFQLFAARTPGHQIESIFDQPGHFERRIFQLHFSRFDFREIENVVDQHQQLLARQLDGFNVVALLMRQARIDQQAG